jgi:predicted SprT family Zn-dependent metalloprotease
MASTRGFANLQTIRRAINELYRGFGPRHLNSYPESFSLGAFASDLRNDPVIGTQRLAKRIASHYRLPVTTVIVTFSSALKTPGRVELSSTNEFFVEVQSQHRYEPKAIAAILAHEVAHIFLHRCGVRLAGEFANEVLTDTTAVYVGFGPTILNAFTENKSYLPGNVVETRTHHFGYLTLDEFGYIIAKRDRLYHTDSTARIDSGMPADAFRAGRSCFQRELRHRPFRNRPWYQRIFSQPSPNGRSQTTLIKPITFFCACCSQGLRIPETRQKLSVRCSNCDSKFICYS